MLNVECLAAALPICEYAPRCPDQELFENRAAARALELHTKRLHPCAFTALRARPPSFLNDPNDFLGHVGDRHHDGNANANDPSWRFTWHALHQHQSHAGKARKHYVFPSSIFFPHGTQSETNSTAKLDSGLLGYYPTMLRK